MAGGAQTAAVTRAWLGPTLIPALVLLVTFAVWPGIDRPFSAPKDLVLAVAAAAALLVSGAGRWSFDAPRILAACWIATLALSTLLGAAPQFSALVREASAALLLFGLLQGEIAARSAVRAIVACGIALSVLAVLQWNGIDPFRALGWIGDHQGERMRVYGTLGNPDFVAAFVGACAPLAAGEAIATERRWRWVWITGTLVMLGGLATTRSFASIIALGCAGAFVIARVAGARRWLVAGAVVVAVGALSLSTRTRSASEALDGRLYLWSVAAPHLMESPLLGSGPGSVEVLWPQWEGAHGDARFRAPQDHVHNDLLEWLLSFGVLGALPRLALIALALREAWRSRDAPALAVGAAIVALVARSLVDFPLARPAELCLFVVLVGLSLAARKEAP